MIYFLKLNSIILKEGAEYLFERIIRRKGETEE